MVVIIHVRINPRLKAAIHNFPQRSAFLFFSIFRLLIGAPPFGVVMLVLVKVTIQTTVENGNL